MQGTRIWILVGWSALTIWGSSAGAAPMYNVTNLGTGRPIGINNQGQVGLANLQVSRYAPARDFFFTPPTHRVYESLGPAAGTLWEPSAQGALPGGSTSPWVNDAGDFATTEAVDGRLQPYVNIGGVKTLIPMIANSAMDPKAINSSGQVVGGGFMNAGDEGLHAFLFSDGTLHDLGTLGGRWGQARAINDQGNVVGWAMVASGEPNLDGEVHAFMYDGAMHDLSSAIGASSSHAYDINSSGAIVGDMSGDPYGGDGAFLLEDGKLTDLNSLLPPNSPWHLLTALSINDVGQIVGIGTSNGWERAFLLTPAELGHPQDVPVPEPGMLALFGLGIVLAARLGRGRRW